MKSFKTLLFTGLLGLAMAGSAVAQTNVYINGSTAFRSQTHNAIVNLMPDEVYAYDQATLSASNYSVFTGTLGGNSVRVKCAWTGSTKGIKVTAGSISVGFLPDTTSPAADGAGTPNVSIASLVSAVPDFCVADTDQSSTIYNGTLYEGDDSHPVTYANLMHREVGVQAFVWIANEGSSANLTNMSPNVTHNLFVNGSIPLALFTGLISDHTNFVYPFGCDPGSGTRTMAFGEAGVGVFSTVVQWFPSPNVTNATPTAAIPTPEDLVSEIPTIEGNGGYSSGGSLAALMGNTFNIDGNPGNCGVAYVGTSDALAAVNAGARVLNWCGEALQVSPTLDMTPVKEGKYSFWGYVRLDRRSTLSGVPLATYTAIADRIESFEAPVKLSDMQVVRAIDGGPISPLY